MTTARADARRKAADLLGDPNFVMPQRVFIDDFYDPQPGAHHTMIGPNGCGKTTLGLGLLARCHELHPDTRGLALVMKPHRGPEGKGRRVTGDPTVSRLTRQLGGKVTRVWPPRKPPWSEDPAFWALWPTHSMDIRQDAIEHRDVFQSALADSYKRGSRWLFGDEALGLTADLKLADDLIAILAKGRSMECGMILATQRPAHVPLHMYSEAKHFFLWRMMDRSAYDRIKDIDSVDPDMVVAILSRLGKHECLYLHPDTDTMAVLT